ncbi:RHS repeat domain-containing protein [Litoribacter populi]|uniref:RHS repeat domain-containing protein n=1 Tax=Litoribacter populi TaxID=2598460 RepID=UPI00117E4E3C|nr:RHS repeat-associated core domain-containing protein [Litoribacter populi]
MQGGKTLHRRNDQASVQDAFEYSYYENTNKLRNVDGGSGNNYTYDEVGNLISDSSEGITGIEWTPYGKIRAVNKSDGTKLEFRYDAAGQRIEKKVGESVQRYIRDASGIPMAIYEADSLSEQSIYGSSRLGIQVVGSQQGYRSLGGKRYELSNHLGNVLAVVTDNIHLNQDSTWAQVSSLTDYYPFGLAMEGRAYQDTTFYRYGFNGMERDDEWKGDGRSYDFGARIYDPKVGRWLSVDPLAHEFPWHSPYNVFNNNPIRFIDPDGRAAVDHIDVEKNDDGTYKVVGGKANSDKNIYVLDKQGKREVLGEMLTEYSFHDEKGNAIVGANINLNDESGQNFFNNEIKNIGLFSYMSNAKGGEPLDFKTRNIPKGLTGEARDQYVYRGMSFQGKIASARDIGNYSAGYVAGIHGMGWGASRFAFDALQTKQEKGTWSTIMFYPFNRVREGQPTHRAEEEGHNLGYSIHKQQQFDREWRKATNPWPAGPKW